MPRTIPRTIPILRDVLPSAAVALTPTATLREALRALDRGRVGGAPIIGAGGVVGTVTAATIEAWPARAAADDGEVDASLDRCTVEEVMTRRVLVLPVQTVLSTALDTMRRLGIHHVVVTEAGKYVGLVSEADLLGPTVTKPRVARGRAGKREPT